MVELIAEVASNAGGDMHLAKDFIKRFAEAGATFVKFQHTRVKHLSPHDPQYAWFAKAEFHVDQFAELKETCAMAGTQFLTTVYHAADVPEVATLGRDVIKVGSGEAHLPALAEAIQAARFARVLVATGLTPAARTPYWAWRGRVEFLRCETRYPCPAVCARGAYRVLGAGRTTGWSDHVVGLDGCRLAVIDGATVIEKHVRLPNQARPEKPFEAGVDEFKQLRALVDDDPTRYLKRWQHA